MFIVDTLSRAHLPLSDHVSQNELKFIQSVEEIDMTQHLAVTRERLADFQGKTKNDAVLHQLKQAIELGWPESRKAVPSEICAFYTYWNKLTVQDEILFRGDRVIVPAAIRLEMLRKIHARHIGIEVSKGNPVLMWDVCSCQGLSLLAEHAIHFAWNNPKSPSCHRKYPTGLGQRLLWIYLHWIRQSI